jgi:hypothetical protein
MRTVARVFFSLCLLVGFGLGSYGVLREIFADVASPADVLVVSDDRFDPSRLTAPRWWEDSLVGVGASLELLPTDRQRSADGRRTNAACAVAGVLLFGIYTLREAFRTADRP